MKLSNYNIKTKILTLLFCFLILIISIYLVYSSNQKQQKLEFNKSLKDVISLNLALMAATPDVSLQYYSGIYGYMDCYNNIYRPYPQLVNGCSIKKECTSNSQQNACAALDIRLKKQGYNLDSSQFINNYISWQEELSDERQNEETTKALDLRNSLVENMANGH